MTKEASLYDLIYDAAAVMNLGEEELNNLLCNADEIERIGTGDLHDLVYRLAERGFLDEDSMNNYLDAADRIAGNDRASK